MCVDRLRVEGASLTAGTEQAKAELDILAALIRGLKAAAATQDRGLGVPLQAVRSLTCLFALGEMEPIQQRLGLLSLLKICLNIGHFSMG